MQEKLKIILKCQYFISFSSRRVSWRSVMKERKFQGKPNFFLAMWCLGNSGVREKIKIERATRKFSGGGFALYANKNFSPCMYENFIGGIFTEQRSRREKIFNVHLRKNCYVAIFFPASLLSASRKSMLARLNGTHWDIYCGLKKETFEERVKRQQKMKKKNLL